MILHIGIDRDDAPSRPESKHRPSPRGAAITNHIGDHARVLKVVVFAERAISDSTESGKALGELLGIWIELALEKIGKALE